MEKVIHCCDNCGEPLVWTFMFNGTEYYCLNCKKQYGIFDSYKKIKNTEELNFRAEVIQEVFAAISKHIIPFGARLIKCRKCYDEHGYSVNMDEYHIHHMTEEEKMKMRIANEILQNISIKKESNQNE